MCEGLDTKVINGKLTKCDRCGGELTYKGLGEYYCTDCEKTIYDDYGTVRVYLEEHPWATIADISFDTGVPKSRIREFVAQDKFVECSRRYIDA